MGREGKGALTAVSCACAVASLVHDGGEEKAAVYSSTVVDVSPMGQLWTYTPIHISPSHTNAYTPTPIGRLMAFIQRIPGISSTVLVHQNHLH